MAVCCKIIHCFQGILKVFGNRELVSFILGNAEMLHFLYDRNLVKIEYGKWGEVQFGIVKGSYHVSSAFSDGYVFLVMSR